MMMNVADVKPNQTFKMLGVEYRLVRNPHRVVDAPKFNAWGRRIDGTYKALQLVVQTNRLHRGWSAPHYVNFPVNASVVV